MTACNSLQNTPIDSINPDKFREIVAERAYLKAEKRDFATGYKREEWLEAEQEVSNQYHYCSQQANNGD